MGSASQIGPTRMDDRDRWFGATDKEGRWAWCCSIDEPCDVHRPEVELMKAPLVDPERFGGSDAD